MQSFSQGYINSAFLWNLNRSGAMPVPASIDCWYRVQTPMHPSKNGLPAGRQRRSVPVPIACHPTCGPLRAARPISAVSDGSLIRKATSSRPRAQTIPSPRSRSTSPSHGTANEPTRATYRSSPRAVIFSRNSASGACQWRNAVRPQSRRTGQAANTQGYERLPAGRCPPR